MISYDIISIAYHIISIYLAFWRPLFTDSVRTEENILSCAWRCSKSSICGSSFSSRDLTALCNFSNLSLTHVHLGTSSFENHPMLTPAKIGCGQMRAHKNDGLDGIDSPHRILRKLSKKRHVLSSLSVRMGLKFRALRGAQVGLSSTKWL